MIGCVTPPDALPNRKFRSLVPDVVYQAVRDAGGYRSWDTPDRDLY
mgnify:CR=1 FL=1